MDAVIVSQRAGRLEFDSVKGFTGNVVVQGDGEPMPISLSIFADVSSEPRLLAQVAPTLDALPELLASAYAALAWEAEREAKLQTSWVLTYLEHHAEQLQIPALQETVDYFRAGQRVIGYTSRAIDQGTRQRPELQETLDMFRSRWMTAEELVARLTVRSLVFLKGDNQKTGTEQLEFWLDFALGTADPDHVLAVKFDASRSVHAVDMES